MVPLGSSSESMYPGYSPAHIEYGKAAGEFGQALGDLKAKGVKVELPANGPEYQIGQAHGAKRKMLFQKNRTESTGSEGAAALNKTEQSAAADHSNTDQVAKDHENGENPYFVIDTNPTPVALLGRLKRPLEGGRETGEKKDKTIKKSEGENEPVIETEDISAEVDARLKEKMEKSKAKEEKKRKRESTGDGEKESKKSKKDKKKKRKAEEAVVDGD